MYRLKVVISEEEQNKILPKPYFGKVIYKKTNNSNNNKNLLMDPNEKIGEIERKSTPEEENKEIEKITIDNIDNLGDHNTLRLSGSCGDKELKIPESNIISFSSGNPSVEIINGVIHLYKDKNSEIHNINLPVLTKKKKLLLNFFFLFKFFLIFFFYFNLKFFFGKKEKRSDLICCYAIPSKIGNDEFIKFIGAFTKLIIAMRVLRLKKKKKVKKI